MPQNNPRFFGPNLVALILAGAVCFPVRAEESLEDLQRIEIAVQQVVSKVMPTVVAVTDGQGFGSGVIISETGLVLTAGHVMASPFQSGYEVILPNGRRVPAKPLGRNLDVDAGMVQITTPGPFPFVDVAAHQPEVGEWVVTMGHSGGYDLGRKPPVRTGRVLRIRDHQVVTDAVLIGGDSGGPLFNLQGEVVGIHSSIGDSIAENRHVSVSTFRKFWTRLVAGESWGTLPELAAAKKKTDKRAKIGVVVDRTAGAALIKSVNPDSPAARAGIQGGDVVSRFDNVAVIDADHLIELVKTKRPGEGFNVEFQRNGFYFNVHVILEKF